MARRIGGPSSLGASKKRQPDLQCCKATRSPARGKREPPRGSWSNTAEFEGNLMNKGELIEAVAAAADLTKADATKAVEAVLEAVTRTLKKGDQVSIVGFGSFSVKSRAARQGRNPKTGATIDIPASRVPGFKAGKALKDAVN
jgi:DNA-binding protein HU-beta